MYTQVTHLMGNYFSHQIRFVFLYIVWVAYSIQTWHLLRLIKNIVTGFVSLSCRLSSVKKSHIHGNTGNLTRTV